MRINTYKYRQWKARQNRKNLIIRTKKKEAIKAFRTYQIQYNKSLKNERNSNYSDTNNRYEYTAPLNFSLINNPIETTDFFSRIISISINKRNYKKRIFIDVSRITTLTIDALMYLLAIINNMKVHFKKNLSISGNAPEDSKVRKLFSESGFYQFVHYIGSEPLTKNENTIQIVSGEKCDTELAKQISDFVCKKSQVSKRSCSFLYNMMIELMSNTHKHAYPGRKQVFYPRWYCFAEYDKNKTISFSFMDTGAGIPTTVRKNFAEQIDLLRIKEDYKYVVSALNGEFRTSTRKGYRGKGLPKIREYCAENKINNLHIITNKADVTINNENICSVDIESSLRGTLYYWQVDLSKLKQVN